MLWLYTLNQIIHDKNNNAKSGTELKDRVKSIIEDKFQPSTRTSDSVFRSKFGILNKFKPIIDKLYEDPEWDKLYNTLNANKDITKDDITKDDLAKYVEIIQEPTNVFNRFVSHKNKEMERADYYSYCFFYHRLGHMVKSHALYAVYSN